MGEPIPVSSLSGKGSGDLLDLVVEALPEVTAVDQEDETLIRVAVVGKPNVGKSSLVNRLIGEERVVVSDIPGTTRPVPQPDTRLRRHSRPKTSDKSEGQPRVLQCTQDRSGCARS